MVACPELSEFGKIRLPEQLRLLPVGSIGIIGVNAIHVFHDREPCGSQRVREQKCAGVAGGARSETHGGDTGERRFPRPREPR